MNYLVSTILFIYGIILGSFFNVIIYRVPRDINIAKGRSMCTTCGKTIKASHLIPIFSWIFLKGKCAYCGEKISIRYLFIELITGVYFVFGFYMFGLNITLIYNLIFWSLLLIVTMIDIDFMYIIDGILISFGVPIILMSIYLLKKDSLYNLLAGIICFAVYLAIYYIAKFFYKREAFGFGDVLLIFLIGFFLGFKLIFLTLFFPFIVAAVYLIFATVFGKKFKLSQEVPLGPYICMSAFILSLYGNQIMKFIFPN